MRWKTEREVYYVCDVGGTSKKKFKQTKLSFGLGGGEGRDMNTKQGNLGNLDAKEGQ